MKTKSSAKQLEWSKIEAELRKQQQEKKEAEILDEIASKKED